MLGENDKVTFFKVMIAIGNFFTVVIGRGNCVLPTNRDLSVSKIMIERLLIDLLLIC